MRQVKFIVAWVGVLATCGMAQAAIQQTSVTNPSETFFTAATDDLINVGSTALLGATHVGFTPLSNQFGTSTTAALNDGLVGPVYTAPGSLDSGAFDLDGTWTSTYTLDTSVNTLGYDITQIRSIAAWPANRASQKFTVAYSTVADENNFLSLGTFALTFEYDGSSQLTLTDPSGKIASGVKKLQFSFLDPAIGGSDEPVYREIDVLGNATVPEPATVAIWSLLASLALVVGWSRRRSA